MTKQHSLFSKLNLPATAGPSRDKNKALLEKVNNSMAVMTQLVRSNTNATQTNAMAKKIEMIKQMASRYFTDKGQYQLIRTEKDYWDYIKAIYKTGKAGLDTETKGLDPILDGMVGLCLYTSGQKPAYIPMHHTDLMGKDLPDQLSDSIVVKGLQEVFDIKWYTHNGKFDNRVLHNSLGMDYLPLWWDTQIAGNLLNENEAHGLKFLHDKYCNKEAQQFSTGTELATGDEVNAAEATYSTLFDGMPFNYVPIDIGYLYAAKDPLMTLELGEFQEQFLTPSNEKCQRQGLTETAELFREIEMPLINVLAEMEDTGLGIDSELAKKLAEEYTEKLYQVEMKIKEFFRKNVNFGDLRSDKRNKLGTPDKIVASSTQLAIIIYDLFKLTSPEREKPRGTGEDILEALSQSSKVTQIQKEFFALVIEHRSVTKLLGTYIEKLPKEVKELTQRLHGTFKQYGAKTGRQSSADPNLQNIPAKNKEIRKMFIPGKLMPFEYNYEGKNYGIKTIERMNILAEYAESDWVFIGADYSQQEPRTLAFVSGDEGMIQAYLEGRDLYAWIGSVVYKVPYEECLEKYPDGSINKEGRKRRDAMKSVVLGLMYSRGAQAIADQLSITKKEAQEVIDLFFESFPKVKKVIEMFLEMARTEGFVTTVYGRKRRLPDIQLPEIEVTYKDGSECPFEEEAYWFNTISRAWGRDRSAFKKEAESKGYKIKDNSMKIADAERQTLNSVIQGTAADITKLALVELSKSEELKKLAFKLLLSVHDEIIGKAPKETARKAAEIMCGIMIDVIAKRITVPMKVDADIVERWYGEDVTNQLPAA
jgi:DNA polymerase I-like protein with 3'-5' exonuclease and polymerase domains